MCAAIKANKQKTIYNIIIHTAELFDWNQIENVKQTNMISYSVGHQRINIWIKHNNKISIRMQPQNKIQKNINVTEIIQVLNTFNDICQYSEEGK